MDAVYLFGGGRGEAELRHSLRSLGYLRQVDRVVVAGEPPDWLAGDVLRIEPEPHPASKHRNTWANLRAACRDRRVSDEFVLMNDDFFALRPVDAVPVWHAGPLVAGTVRTAHQDQRRDSTLAMLGRVGAAGRLSYELHVPMVMHRPTMAGLMRMVEGAVAGRPFDPPVWKRTLYGNFAHPGLGQLHEDVKIRTFDEVPATADVFVSVSDYTWQRGAVGRWLRDRFAEPCRYEKR